MKKQVTHLFACLCNSRRVVLKCFGL